MKHAPLSAVLVAVLLLISPALALSEAESSEIRAKMAQFKGKDFGCTRTRKAMRKIAAAHPNYHFAFAGRKALTITGIRGCGYAWNVDAAAAQATALKICKQWEQAYGTAGGTRTCQLMR